MPATRHERQVTHAQTKAGTAPGAPVRQPTVGAHRRELTSIAPPAHRRRRPRCAHSAGLPGAPAAADHGRAPQSSLPPATSASAGRPWARAEGGRQQAPGCVGPHDPAPNPRADHPKERRMTPQRPRPRRRECGHAPPTGSPTNRGRTEDEQRTNVAPIICSMIETLCA